MSKVAVYNQAGEKTTEMDVNPRIFGIPKLDVSLVHSAVRAQRNNARHSIAHTKNRGEVSGSGKKPWKQKGTGRARAGSIRSPLWKGGGVTFGPTSNRNFSLKLNRSAFRKAIFSVLTDKLNENRLIILDQIPVLKKTKELAGFLNNVLKNANFGRKNLLIIDKHNKDIERAAKNLVDTKIITADQLNILDLLNYDAIILKEALPVIEKTYL